MTKTHCFLILSLFLFPCFSSFSQNLTLKIQSDSLICDGDSLTLIAFVENTKETPTFLWESSKGTLNQTGIQSKIPIHLSNFSESFELYCKAILENGGSPILLRDTIQVKVAKNPTLKNPINSFQKENNIFLELPPLESERYICCLLYTSPSPRDATLSRMPSSA